jgi:nucleotide-sensitive chloride channel 1A
LDSGIFFPNQQLPQDEEERQEIVTELRLIPRDSGAGKKETRKKKREN